MKTSIWTKLDVIREFKKRGTMTAEELGKIICCSSYDAPTRARRMGVPLRVVGSVKDGANGRPPKLFALEDAQ